jgi:hypothetical protein
VLLAFVPSSMLLGVTTYLSTDVAPIPLLWIAPLAVYLLTFVVAFSERVWFREQLLLPLHAVFVVWIGITMAVGVSGLITVMAPAHIALLFLTGLLCHGALAKDRPPVRHLTEFYLWLSFGGMLGGLFNALVAPHVFNTVAEYPIAIVAAAAVRPMLSKRRSTLSHALDLALPLALAGVLLYLTRNGFPIPGMGVRASLVAFASIAAVCLTFFNRPLRFAFGLAAIFAGAAVGAARNEQLMYRGRSFFGVYKVVRMQHIRALQHGTTIHGLQSTYPEEALEPMTYFHRRGPIGQIFSALFTNVPSRRVGIVGLGTGSLGCYGRPGEPWTFYEIDPLIERIARTNEYFTFLRDCPPKMNVVIGDGRLSLLREPDSSFDLLILDAFGSDAVPVHLLTQDAMRLYVKKLKPNGIMAFHISNRYLDLEPVLARAANSLGLTYLLGSDDYMSQEDRGLFRSLSRWVIVSRRFDDVRPLTQLPGWRPIKTLGTLWTDDFSNVLSVYRRRQ